MTTILGVIGTLALIFGLSYPLGRYISKVYSGQKTWSNFMKPLEAAISKLSGLDTSVSMTWQQNVKALLVLNLVFFIWAIVILLTQAALPLNPDGIPNMELTQAFNTAVSFMTNTNLQHYSGETGASYFTQLLVFTYLQFVSAATGMACLVLLFNGIKQSGSGLIGNFYHYFILSTTRVLFPLALIVAGILLFNGSPMTLSGAQTIKTAEGLTQRIAVGPVAAMVAIKQLGTNGGGYFGPNSTHPLENPNYLTNMVECASILLIPVAMVWAFGFYAGKRRMATVLFCVMFAGFTLLLIPTIWGEVSGNPLLNQYGVQQSLGSTEGKELRFGAAASALWGVATTSTSNGSVNAMHDSFTALSGTWLLLGMMVNSFFGGVGVGFLNMYIFIILAVFIGGLMIGRTPELFGKKIEPREIKIAALVFLLHPLLILTGTGLASYYHASHPDVGWLNNPGFHGFSEMLYEFTSASANNGSGFEGLMDNTPFWNLSTGLVMLFARFLPIIGPLAIAGWLANKHPVATTSGTLQTDSTAFGILLFSVIIILSALAFFPALALGPVAEYLSY